MAGRFGANAMTFTTAKSDLHAIRRAPLNPMFSKRSVAKFEPVIRDKVDLMVKRITEAKKNSDVLVTGVPLKSTALLKTHDRTRFPRTSKN